MTQKKIRIIMAMIGVTVGGLSVGLFKNAFLGIDPYQCFMAGLSNVIPIGFGTLYVIVNLIMFAFMFFCGKHFIGVATFINMFLLGYVVEFSTNWIATTIPDPSLLVRIIFLVSGVVILCFASAMYFTANLGVSTYDAVALIMAEKKIAKFKFCRIATDFVCVVIGFFLSADIGIGTVVTAFFMGPLIDFFRVKVSDPFVKKFK